MKVFIENLKSAKRKFFGLKKDPFFIQELSVKRTNDRLKLFTPFLKGKKVLHVGCTDYPIFKPERNLHIKIESICKELHGMDIDQAGLDILEKHVPGKYFNSLDKADSIYDTILVPETIEHVENIQIFLSEINKIKANTYIITGPNCFHSDFKNGFKDKGEIFIENVHPDHNCWFSPYTLKNCIEKYTNLSVVELHLSERDKMIVCICVPNG
ncbi:class I SAM-dependent methyltransferase [Arthrospiribacter ruber]|uniref:Methyltransferase domain-containing protein n=1 Tax=Arthrospiribacter ruber TaxID=2487934 RepID=A0A951IS62_9BACT|nr:class I SAM-dependent methyltransferase [Arthrospiribacter ruber]MBW3466588.1 hypothetical protein [Arthrospiribacter ruber]